jgi:hypothetical protein
MISLGANNGARAETEIQVKDLEISHIFKEQIDIQARIIAEIPIHNFKVVIQSEDNTVIGSESVSVTPDGEVFYILDITDKPIRAFSELIIFISSSELKTISGIFEASLTTAGINFITSCPLYFFTKSVAFQNLSNEFVTSVG